MARHQVQQMLRRALSSAAAPLGRVGIGKVGIPGVGHIFAVASGKGGVGKSTTAVNLACALAMLDRNLRVGLLDADVYGPSIHRMMKLSGRPQLQEGGKMVPLENYGVRCMSMGFLMEEDTAAVWRGPMVMSALDSFCTKVDWAGTNVMVIDMPPGTGDAQISISQRLPLSGAVIVSTPQDIALIDARRGVSMFQKVNVPILGVVENQSHYVCPGCGHEAHIFGHDGAAAVARELGVELLGKIPLDIRIREQADAGVPVVVAAPDSPQAKPYLDIAARVREKMEAGAEAGGGGPTISVV